MKQLSLYISLLFVMLLGCSGSMRATPHLRDLPPDHTFIISNNDQVSISKTTGNIFFNTILIQQNMTIKATRTSLQEIAAVLLTHFDMREAFDCQRIPAAGANFNQQLRIVLEQALLPFNQKTIIYFLAYCYEIALADKTTQLLQTNIEWLCSYTLECDELLSVIKEAYAQGIQEPLHETLAHDLTYLAAWIGVCMAIIAISTLVLPHFDTQVTLYQDQLASNQNISHAVFMIKTCTSELVRQLVHVLYPIVSCVAGMPVGYYLYQIRASLKRINLARQYSASCLPTAVRC